MTETKTKNSLAADVKKNLSALTPQQAEDLTFGVTASVVSATLLFRASRAARRGNYGRAIYLAVIWAGFSNNVSNTFQAKAAHREKAKGRVSSQGFTWN